MKKLGLLILFFSFLGALNAQINITTSGSYSQDFNTLISTGSGTWTDNSTVSNWYLQRSGTGTSIVADAGGATAGNAYSYGTTSTTERALGSLGSGNVAAGSFAWGVLLQNTSGFPISDIKVSYTGEQWRNGGAGAQTITFWYRTSATSFTNLNPGSNTGWTAVTLLDFTSPINGGTGSALNGNLAANRVVFPNIMIPGIVLNNNEYIMLRWSDPDHTGTDHGLSIDDVNISWTLPNITTSLTTLTNFQYPEGSGPSTSLSYNLSGTGLSPQDGNLTINGSTNYEVSTDNTSFNSSVNLVYTLGTLSSTPVYVRLKAGLTQGFYNGEQIVNSGGGANDIIVTCDGEVGAPLPVELTSFSATTIGKDVKLSWNTATEINNYGFEVERSVVKGEWNKIGFVNGNGNSNSPKDYSFVDDKVVAGKYSYRLKQIDNDGQFEYSKVIEIDVNGTKKFELTQNYPNPFNPTTTIQFQLPVTGMVKLTLYNILGQEIKTLVNEVKEAGTHIINFDATELNSGVYIYKIESGSFTQTRKMTLVK